MDFPIALAFNSKVPPSQQLVTELRRSINEGRLSPGQSLPSTRELADMLSLSRSTVVKAYRRLLSEGFLESQVGSGTYVKRGFAPGTSVDECFDGGKTGLAALASAQLPVVSSLSNLSRAIMDVESLPGSAPDAFELNRGCSPADLLPNRQWRQLLSRHCRTFSTRLKLSDNEAFGYRPLREALAAFFRRSKAVNCTADQVIVLSGSQIPLYFVASLLVKENDRVVLENPGYAGTRNILDDRGAHLFFCDVDENGMQVDDLDAIEEACRMACVSVSHQDPTGAIMSIERRRKLIEWAIDRQAYIFEDAWDSDYHYGQQSLPALQGLDQSGSVIYSYSFFKLLFPIVTMSVLVVPEHLISSFARARTMMEIPLAPVEHYALADFIGEGQLECHIGRSRSIYEGRRQALIFNLTRYLTSSVEIAKHSAGLHQLVRFRVPLTENEIMDCARKAKLPLVPTRSYYVTEAMPNEFLVPFGLLDRNSIEKKILDFAVDLQSRLRNVLDMSPGEF